MIIIIFVIMGLMMQFENDLYDFIINNTADGIMIKNSEGIVEFLNPAAISLFGHAQSNLVGKTSHSNVVHAINEDYSELSADNHPSVLVNKNKIPILNRRVGLVKNDNSISWVKINCFPYKSGTISIFKDISEEKKEKSHADTLINALDSVSLVSATNLKGEITYVNERFCEKTQYTKDELIGKNHRIIKSDKHSNEFFKILWDTILEGKIFQGEICNKKKNGELFWGHSTIIPLFENNKIISFLGIRFDITEKKKLEEILETSSKLSTLGEISASIAHEINNPLTILLGKTNIILKAIEKQQYDFKNISDDLIKVERAGQKISKIVRGLKSLSRHSDTDPKESILLSKILEDVIELSSDKLKMFDVQLLNNINIDITIDCNPSQISQVLINLISNSIDAVEKLDTRWISLNLIDLGETLQIIVTDSGNGISDDTVSKMMSPFFTTKPSGKGTGLGLSISKKIIEELHHGKFYYSRQNQYTTFVIELPKKSD